MNLINEFFYNGYFVKIIFDKRTQKYDFMILLGEKEINQPDIFGYDNVIDTEVESKKYIERKIYK